MHIININILFLISKCNKRPKQRKLNHTTFMKSTFLKLLARIAGFIKPWDQTLIVIFVCRITTESKFMRSKTLD